MRKLQFGLGECFHPVLHIYWFKKPKHPIKFWKQQFPKRGIWPRGVNNLREYYFNNLSMYCPKLAGVSPLTTLSSKKYKKANWNKAYFNKKETREILADRNYTSMNKLIEKGYLTPQNFNKRIIYFSSQEIQRILLMRELMMGMSDNIKLRDAKLRQYLKQVESSRRKRSYDAKNPYSKKRRLRRARRKRAEARKLAESS